MTGNIRELGIDRQVQTVAPGDLIREPESANEQFGCHGFGLERARKSVHGELPLPDRVANPAAESGVSPEDLFHRVSGERPGELLLLPETGGILDPLECSFDQGGAVFVQDALRQVGIPIVEMRFEHDDDIFQPGIHAGMSRGCEREQCRKTQCGQENSDVGPVDDGHTDRKRFHLK